MTGMLILGLMAATGAAEALPRTDNTVFFYPREADAESIALPGPGAYALWVFMPARAETVVTVAGTALEAKPETDGAGRDDRMWVHAGTLDLSMRSVEVRCAPEVIMAALSRQAEFDPAAALLDARVLAPGDAVEDRRATLVRDTNTVFTMSPYRTLEDWEDRAALLRKRILLGSGLYPLPEKTPLNARIFDETECDGYAVAKVHFEPWPGFLATGNLYRPLGEGPFPAIINPHGHWEKGRMENSERAAVAARGITFARMGAVALVYDMIGYVDSRQTPHNWGDDREKLWGIHTFGMQLWTSIRALDLVEELPYVDAARLGCTGASGGGTQTFALTAVDPRVQVSSPVNMISSTMQGGCLCENAPILRLDNSNMEVGALAAPRPMLLVSATGDWTRETPRVEYPAIRSVYELYGAGDKVANAHFDYGHNFNQDSREAVYRFFGEHLLGGDFAAFTEPPHTMPPEDALRVFPGEDPPQDYQAGEALIDTFVDQARERRARRVHHVIEGGDAPDADAFAALMGVETPDAAALQSERFHMEERDGYVLEKWILGRACAGDRIPAVFYRGRDAAPQDAVLLVHGRGKAALADVDSGGPGPLVKDLLDRGLAVLAIDAFLVGEHHGADAVRTRVVAGRFHDTFLPTDAGCRVQDVLTARAFLTARRDLTGVVDVIGLEQGGLWCLFAGAIDHDFRRVMVDMNRFDSDDDQAWLQYFYVPGLRAVGDIPAAIMAGAPGRFALYNAQVSEELTAVGVDATSERFPETAP